MPAGPLWLPKNDDRTSDVSLVGEKGHGLSTLPPKWSPDYVVLTTAGVAAMRARRARRDKPFLPGISSPALHRLLRSSRDGLIVRSSSASETLGRRGALRTEICQATLDAVTATIWRLETPDPLAPTDVPEPNIAYVVQQYRQQAAVGHLSNERRVSRDRRSWLCETEVEAPPDQRSFRLRADSRSEASENLRCRNFAGVKPVVRHVARLMTQRPRRYHLEWVWDGDRLWIVQADEEPPPPVGRDPATFARRFASGTSQRVRTRAFTAPPRRTSRWPKVEHIRTFRRAGLPGPAFYILSGAPVAALFAGAVCEQVAADLERLLRTPLVIRSDMATDNGAEAVLAPRSNACTSAGEAEEFLLDAARAFKARGVSPDAVAFIAHHFIPARSGAFALASPGNDLVRIDATWGFPDSLLYYPHDSFEVDLGAGRTTLAHPRCKDHYIGLDADGAWRPARAGTYDWRVALDSDERLTVARLTRQLADRLRTPIEVMFFAGVIPSSGLPRVIPWYFTKESPRLEDIQEAGTYYIGERYRVTDDSSLDELGRFLAARDVGAPPVSISLRPSFEFLRDVAFVERVAETAKRWRCIVELEGSILSHAFYVLNRSGAMVRAVDPFVGVDRRQQFGKLVRELIPVRIERRGELPTVYSASREELTQLLREKVLEEALEFYWSPGPENALEELGDIYELISAYCNVRGVGIEDVERIAAMKRRERGGFEAGVVLVETRRASRGSQRPRAAEAALFDEDRGAIRQARSLPRRPRPYSVGTQLILPVIPPSTARPEAALRVAPVLNAEIEVRYTQDQIVIDLDPEPAPAPEQLHLEGLSQGARADNRRP